MNDEKEFSNFITHMEHGWNIRAPCLGLVGQGEEWIVKFCTTLCNLEPTPVHPFTIAILLLET
jgi:hypothetical protein